MKYFWPFIFGIFLHRGDACMRTTSPGGGNVPVPCALATSNAGLFVGTGTTFLDQLYGTKAAVGNCATCATGSLNYYAPAADPVPHQTLPLEAIGSLNMANCPNMCVCSTTGTCYTRATDDTVITFWPFCSGGVCTTYGYLSGLGGATGLTPVGGGTGFTSDAQVDPNTFDPKPVTDASYPKIASASCNGCPITMCS